MIQISLYCRLTLKPRPSKAEKKQPSFYTNPRAPKSQPQNGTMTIVMTDIMESHDNETYEEPEDEVQEVPIHAGFNLVDSKSAVSSIRICSLIDNLQ